MVTLVIWDDATLVRFRSLRFGCGSSPYPLPQPSALVVKLANTQSLSLCAGMACEFDSRRGHKQIYFQRVIGHTFILIK